MYRHDLWENKNFSKKIFMSVVVCNPGRLCGYGHMWDEGRISAKSAANVWQRRKVLFDPFSFKKKDDNKQKG